MQRTTQVEEKEIGNEEFYKMTDREKEQAVIDYFFKGGGGTARRPLRSRRG
jgi:hypothetical protein